MASYLFFIVKRYSAIDFKSVDFAALAKELARGEEGLDIDYCSTEELIDLYPKLDNLIYIRTVIENVLKSFNEKISQQAAPDEG